MFRSTFKFIALVSLLLAPAVAQFGLPQRKKDTSFEALNELAAKQQQKGGAAAGGVPNMPDLAALQAMMAGDPGALESLGAEFAKAMEELSKMDPAELQQQMEEAMKLMSQGDIVENIIDKKDEVLQNLEQTGLVSAEELEKFQNDPAYFESQMRDAFDQMTGMFSDPEVLKTAAETMKGLQDAFSDPAIGELTKLLDGIFDDDDKIEDARLQLLSDPALANNPMIASLFNEDEFNDILKDPKKWRESVKEGQSMFEAVGAGGLGAGAGVGEL